MTGTMLPLKSIVFMERSEENSIREIPFSQAYPYIIRQTYLPRDNERAKRTLSLVSSMYGKASFWLFSCNNFAPDCFMKSYNALINDGK